MNFEISNLSELIEIFNVLKYVDNNKCVLIIEQNTNIKCANISIKINSKIGKFLSILKNDFIKNSREVDILDIEDYLEILENYKVYEKISLEDFNVLLDIRGFNLYKILKYKKIVQKFDLILKEKIQDKVHSAELLISSLNGDSNISLPKSLSYDEILKIFDNYIESEDSNINYLQKIVEFPLNVNFKIPDKIKLKAKSKEKTKRDELFNNQGSLKFGFSISYPNDLEKTVEFSGNISKFHININRKWIEDNLDYPTLWNNFIYLFNIVDLNSRLTLVSKIHSLGAFESFLLDSGKHLYVKSAAFEYTENFGNLGISSYISVLKTYKVRIEDMIEWFFKDYIRNEFNIENFIVNMPSDATTYLEKCRFILPEIDGIFKQYNLLIEEGFVNHELREMSSHSYEFNQIKSFSKNKYIYANSEVINLNNHLLYSDQSGIFYIENKSENFKNFYDLLMSEKVKLEDFYDFQVEDIKRLIDQDIISIDDNGYLIFSNIDLVILLKEFYYEEVVNYYHCSEKTKDLINDMISRNLLVCESTLLSRNEHDYFDYYLNKSKYTNGHEIRNHYIHGTNIFDENQYKNDYFMIIKLIIIIVLKINDDLCIKYN